jgi:hypothetical protein
MAYQYNPTTQSIEIEKCVLSAILGSSYQLCAHFVSCLPGSFPTLPHFLGTTSGGAPEGKETRHNRSTDTKGSSQDEPEGPRVLAEDNGKTFRSAPVDQVRAECKLKRPCNARPLRPLRAGKGGDGAYNGGSPVEDEGPKKRPSKVAEYAKAVYKEKPQSL